MKRITYLSSFVASTVALILGLLFACAAIAVPARWPLAMVLLGIGVVEALLYVGRQRRRLLRRRHRAAEQQRLDVRRRYDFGDAGGKCFSYHRMLRSI